LRSPAVLIRETSRLATAILSQLMRASSTFVIPLIAVRLLDIAAFSRFNIIVAIFGFCLAAFSSFASDPILTFFTKAGRDGLGRYVRLIDRFSVIAGGVVALGFLALALFGWATGMPLEVKAGLGLAMVVPPFFLAQARDRLAFAVTTPHVALASNATALVISLGCVVGLALLGRLDIFGLLVSVALGQWASYLLYRFNSRVAGGEEDAAVNVRESVNHHVTFGRWAVGGQFLWWCMTNFFLFALPWMGDVEAAGKFRLIQSLNMPATLAVGAAALFITPRLTRMDHGRARRFATLFYGATLVAAPLYVAMMGLVSGPLLHVIADGKMHLTLAEAWIAGGVPVANGLLMFAVAAARARGQARLQMQGNLIGLALTVPLGLLLAHQYGLVGALIGQCAGLTVAAIGVELMLHRRKPGQ